MSVRVPTPDSSIPLESIPIITTTTTSTTHTPEPVELTETTTTTQAFTPLNPRPMLQGLVGKDVLVRIKWGQEYTGRLVSVDAYMNVLMSNAREWKTAYHPSRESEEGGVLGQVFIRCNNVLWITARDLGTKAHTNGDQQMDG